MPSRKVRQSTNKEGVLLRNSRQPIDRSYHHLFVVSHLPCADHWWLSTAQPTLFVVVPDTNMSKGMKFLNKKSWHTAKIQNIEQVTIGIPQHVNDQ
jgi:hypothetical protein